MYGRRLNAVVAVVLAVVLLWGLFGHHPTTRATGSPFEPGEPAGPYAATMTLETNGAHFVTYEIRDDHADGEQLVTASFPNVTFTTYWHDNRTVTRYVSETEEQYRRTLRLDDDERVLQRDDESLTAVVADSDEDDASDGPGLLLSVLSSPGYERTGTTTVAGEAAIVYEARSGWYEAPRTGSETIRVENAAGTLVVGSDTGQLYAANVTYETVPAGTWAAYLYEDYVEGSRTSTDVTVEYRPGPTDVDRPAWASTA